MIEVKNLIKDYGGHRALHGISFTVENGHVYGFLGPNGAGKSTTMNIITGCLAATSGTVSVDGHDIYKDPIEAKKRIGYLPELPPLYMDMKVSEYLDFVGRAKGLRSNELYGQIDEVIALTGLEQVYGRMIRNLSKGYRQRVGIAQALLGNPEVIILDEPTVGLDPIQIIEIRELIKSLAANHTVILSSHILQEISAVCDRIIMIANGRVVANDTMEGLEKTYSAFATVSVTARAPKNRLREVLMPIARDGVTVETAEKEPGLSEATVRYPAVASPAEAIWRLLCGAGIPVLAMVPHVTTLEEVFLSLTLQKEEVPVSVPFASASSAGAPDEKDGGENTPDGAGTAEENGTANKNNAENEKKSSGDDDDYTPLFS